MAEFDYVQSLEREVSNSYKTIFVEVIEHDMIILNIGREPVK